ncbi:hypothetical protein [Streptomyces sp. NPDC051219]|uniref:hypothetical protein n=1 Tax=Streptomyces sp. NPDC051219 TaxID=3155283 RepID=UPI00342E3360
MQTPLLDWRGTPIAPESRVLFPRKWGRSAHSTEMAEGTVKGFTPAGRVNVEILRHSRPRSGGGTASACYGVPAHSVTVVPAEEGQRPGAVDRSEGSPAAEMNEYAFELELSAVVRVKAPSYRCAREVAEAVQSYDVQAVLGESAELTEVSVSLEDGDAITLIERNGEPV